MSDGHDARRDGRGRSGGPRRERSAGGDRRRGRERPPAPNKESLVGAEAELDLTDIAHGGRCVGRVEGQVVFVRHGIPGERVRAVVTKGREGDRFVFADAVEVLTPSEDRVEPRCPVAVPGGCGGCDFQHVTLPRQRHLKAQVVRTQLSRLAKIDRDLEVRPVPGDTDGLRWRTRVEFAVDEAGRAGLRPQRSHDVIPLADCPIATEGVVGTGVLDADWSGMRAVDVVAPSVGEPTLVPIPVEDDVVVEIDGVEAGEQCVVEHVDAAAWQGDFEVHARGFWQVHPGAAATFVDHVLGLLRPEPGERALDLYAGVGLFARAIVDAVGPDGAVLAIEGDERACVSLAALTPDVEQLEVRHGDVARELAPLVEGGDEVDLVVLDPPRTGAGADVVQALAALHPRAIAYVACDPAALARDIATAAGHGYELADVVAFDAFPMTHHVETIALLVPSA
ncbi:class I SAM-dependent RNA methyltransferase [Mobilicoccus pelagius]|uniref:Putative RNA methyltransferase n=1 Tax=Mobilicoccus pelagius NBRC 104925 TaxID=1089455 RepID=H5UUM0_9MICO|nr:TRAM domain-containing protein [Mobilicoccus pelagius]GAB49428.1 putative RNA methyltransferase [Mobilicoccus pelagius NBRC 104925]